MASLRLQWGFRSIEVPFALLFSTDLTPAAKFLWIRMRFDEARHGKRSHHPRQLAKRTCLARSTVYEALRQGMSTGWLVKRVDPASGKRRWRTNCPVKNSEKNARIPVDLIRAAHSLRPQAILCYGVLQATEDFKFETRAGMFKWAELRELTRLDLRTIKRAVRALVDARWVAMAQEHRRAPILFRLQHADEAYREETRRRLERASYVGEALMRSFLSLITDTNECEDGARPEFLINPASGERMELDRYYPMHRVAFEFNGRQHYVATGPFTKQDVAAQKKRDRLKQRICKERDVNLVIVHAEDLSLTGILRKVGSLLPRKALRGFKKTIRYLNFCGLRYQLRSKSAADPRRPNETTSIDHQDRIPRSNNRITTQDMTRRQSSRTKLTEEAYRETYRGNSRT